MSQRFIALRLMTIKQVQTVVRQLKIVGYVVLFGLTMALSGVSAQQSPAPVPVIEAIDIDLDENAIQAQSAAASSADPTTQSTNQSTTQEYRDTEFGELLYNEASVATRLEVLGLLSKDTPSVLVFLHAISMGLGIEDMLQAAVQYEPEKARDFAQSAITLLPLLSDSEEYNYAEYELDDIERDSDTQAYSVQQVIDRFFEDRRVLGPQPDWLDGQHHFMASAQELKDIQQLEGARPQERWYAERNGAAAVTRPVFISLYESDKSILIDGQERIDAALRDNPADAKLPVVFVYNRERERSIDQLTDELQYSETIRGVQRAYLEYSLMVTPTPEWELGEYHNRAEMAELNELFTLPQEDDFEPEHWKKLLVQAEAYKKTQPAFLIVIFTGDEDALAGRSRFVAGQQYAAYQDPRAEADYPYVTIKDDDGNSSPLTIKALMSQGLVLNRPDLIAALIAIGETTVPIAFYYIDNARTKPYTLGPRALRLFATGLQPPGLPGGGGGFGPPPECASPPCANQ